MELMTYIDNKTKRVVVLNKEGEIVNSGVFVTDQEMQNKQKQHDAYRQKLNRDVNVTEGRLEHHVACFQSKMKHLIPNLSLTSCGFIISLLAKLKLNSDNVLVSKNKPMTLCDIQLYMGKGRTQTSAQLKRLVEMEVLLEEKVGRSKQYRFNPSFHLMGKHSNKNEHEFFIRLYKGKLQEMLNELSLKEVGFIYKCLPVCHYESFYLVERPNVAFDPAIGQTQEQQLGFLNCTELAAYMNEDVDTVTAVVKSLQSKGFLMKTLCAGALSYRLHPYIVYPVGSVSNERIKAICEDFILHKVVLDSRKQKRKEHEGRLN